METFSEVIGVLDEVLSLKGRAKTFTRETQLLGALPELDSMSVVYVLASLEERFGVSIFEEGVTVETFATVGSLCDFVTARRAT